VFAAVPYFLSLSLSLSSLEEVFDSLGGGRIGTETGLRLMRGIKTRRRLPALFPVFMWCLVLRRIPRHRFNAHAFSVAPLSIKSSHGRPAVFASDGRFLASLCKENAASVTVTSWSRCFSTQTSSSNAEGNPSPATSSSAILRDLNPSQVEAVCQPLSAITRST